MLKYKDTYFIAKQKDSEGNNSENKDDTYIRCKNKKTQIYRYNSGTLGVQFGTKIYANHRVNELTNAGINLIPFLIGDNEQVYLFNESDLEKVSEIVEAKKRIKKNLTDEQRNEIRERFKKNVIKSDD